MIIIVPLLIISIFSYLVPIFWGIKNRFTLLWLYAVTGFTFDLLVTSLKRILHINYHWATNLFVLIEFILIAFLYKDKIYKQKLSFLILNGSICCFFIITTLYKSLNELNTFGYSIFLFSYILYGIFGLLTILKKQEIVFLEKSSFFWMNVAFILYASGDFLSILFTDYAHKNAPELFVFLWSISFKVFNILKNLLLAKALSCNSNDI